MKKVLLIISNYKTGAKKLSEKISAFLRGQNFEPVHILYDGYDTLNSNQELLAQNFEFVISLGGDGNVLFASRFAAPRGIPVVPINFGQFGFIANIEPANWQSELTALLAGKQQPHWRMLLCVQVIRSGKKCAEYNALNEAVIASSGIAKLTSVDIFYNQFSFGTFRSDGVIVSSPTGSTGYAVAAGGPILDPSMLAFVVLPIAPFTLSNRPLVLPAIGELKLRVLPQRQKQLMLSLDGQQSVPLQSGDEVIVSQSKTPVNLIGCSQEHFYKVLQAKLGWSGTLNLK